MRNVITVLGSLLVVASIVSAQTAEECHPDPYLLKVGNYYIVVDMCQPECLFSVWIYEETNGVEELQRCDEAHKDNCFPGEGDPPGCPAGPDTVIA